MTSTRPKTTTKSTTKTKKRVQKSPETRPSARYLAPEDRPGTGPKWVEQMYDWMVNIHGSTPKTALRLRKEVLKLANGEGVRYESAKYGWKEDQYFMKGQRVTPLSDFVDPFLVDCGLFRAMVGFRVW